MPEHVLITPIIHILERNMLQGTLRKMRAEASDPIHYFLRVGDSELPLTPLLGKTIRLKYNGNIFCSHCGRKTNKSFSQGFCFPCMKSLAQCDMCILKPETCHFDQGTCREPDWAQSHCFVPHYVYLSNTSGIKVGITRHSQIPTRWIDQGATQALRLFEVSDRKQSGLIETLFKSHIADKTNWRAMLKGDAEDRDLVAEAKALMAKLSDQLIAFAKDFEKLPEAPLDNTVTHLKYPVLEHPKKITSHNFDKNPLVEGTLLGIKGQYLMFDTGVINIRKFTAYEVEVTHD